MSVVSLSASMTRFAVGQRIQRLAIRKRLLVVALAAFAVAEYGSYGRRGTIEPYAGRAFSGTFARKGAPVVALSNHNVYLLTNIKRGRSLSL